MHLLFIFLFSFVASVSAQASTWRGLKVESENRCAPYNRSEDYRYSQTVELRIVKSFGNKIYAPYSGRYFSSIKETDIDHIVSLSEAHDSGLCRADKATKSRFASDILNLTLASPAVNRYQKSGHDASGWLPQKNKCWFANKVIAVKRAYNLTVDAKELVALKKVVSDCSSFEMIFFKDTGSPKNNERHTVKVAENPNVKKSKSGICHLKSSSSYYARVKYFTSYQSLESCLSSGGRCPKRDSQCNVTRVPASSQKNNERHTVKVGSSPSQQKNNERHTVKVGSSPYVKKSKSGICHLKSSSSYYARVKYFTSYQSLESCLSSGGRCPKRDSQCNARIPASY